MRSSHIPLQQSLLSFLPVLSDSPSSLSHTPHLSLHHLHQLRQHPFYLPTLHLIVVEVHIIQKFITQLLIHVPTIACGYYGDGGKFAGILVCLNAGLISIVGSISYRMLQ